MYTPNRPGRITGYFVCVRRESRRWHTSGRYARADERETGKRGRENESKRENEGAKKGGSRSEINEGEEGRTRGRGEVGRLLVIRLAEVI